MAREKYERLEYPEGTVPFTGPELLSVHNERAPFALLQGTLEETPDGYKISIPELAPFASDKVGRKSLEKDERGYRWAAGGALMILKCKDATVALVRHRDAGAPSFGDHWTLGSGLSTSGEDLVNPRGLMVREAVEEFIIKTPAGIVAPSFTDPALNEQSGRAVAAAQDVRRALGGGWETDSLEGAPASLVPLRGESTMHIEIAGTGDIAPVRGLIVKDDTTRGLDIIGAVCVDLTKYTLAEIAVYDGEVDGNRKSLEAPVGCLRVERSASSEGEERFAVDKSFTKVFLKGMSEDDLSKYVFEKMTPPLEKAIEALSFEF